MCESFSQFDLLPLLSPWSRDLQSCRCARERRCKSDLGGMCRSPESHFGRAGLGGALCPSEEDPLVSGATTRAAPRARTPAHEAESAARARARSEAYTKKTPVSEGGKRGAAAHAEL